MLTERKRLRERQSHSRALSEADRLIMQHLLLTAAPPSSPGRMQQAAQPRDFTVLWVIKQAFGGFVFNLNPILGCCFSAPASERGKGCKLTGVSGIVNIGTDAEAL